MTLRLDTTSGVIPIDWDDIDDSNTTPVQVDEDAMLSAARGEANAAAAACEKAAQRLERLFGRDVLISTSRAAAVVRGGA